MKGVEDKVAVSSTTKGFKGHLDRTIPIVMKDRHKIEDLKEILNSLKGVANFELEDYIEQLELIAKEFTSRISNNLKTYGIKEGTAEITKDILDKLIILGKDTDVYNCHGWSFGCVSNLPLSSKKDDLLKELSLYKALKKYDAHIDYSTNTFYSKKTASLKPETIPTFVDGSVITYYKEEITHSARYVENIDWYTYEAENYEEWYLRDRGVISFDEDGKTCTLKSYVSKLGMGHLVAHEYEDLVPLYGADLAFYSFE